ncbi:MAG: 2-oxoacid:acceptor oxidoreductase family protein [Nanoarchaeota archaeon]|nr:2-oxoacid:acceptor oxidoreductase family protein [Nanoarchaeota archaeon]MBU1027428.1 2-oxoacid:acceptor oxidoreductase family protein [Nanoarchaeota archaeon]
MRYNILFGGQAGQGPNILGEILGEALVKQGYYVFYSRDYQSLIRGGHNFNVLTFSDSPIHSNDSKIDVLVALDENTKKIHSTKMKKEGIILDGKHENMYFAGRLFKLLCLDFETLNQELRELKKKYEENLKNAKLGYEEETKNICHVKNQKNKIYFLNGSKEISQGAIESGLDVYYAYPMTPATPVLRELAEKQIEKNYLVLEPENEIAVINSAIGSAITGAKVMIGTSGGGFDLMTEGLSMAGIAGVPLVVYLAQRPGPASGVPTYTAQGDLNIARHAGHGEFPRMVLAPGDPIECRELTNQAFYFSQKYKIPCIVLNDKHLAESFYSLKEIPKIIKSQKTISLGKFNSYESTSEGISTEDSKRIEKNNIERLKKVWDIEKEAEKFIQYKNFGKKNSKNLIVSWGSTKGAILDAIQGLDTEFLQILYMEPFPKEILKFLKNKNIILIENNATAQLGQLITEKTGIFIEDKNKILRFDGRPFLADELNLEVKKRLN